MNIHKQAGVNAKMDRTKTYFFYMAIEICVHSSPISNLPSLRATYMSGFTWVVTFSFFPVIPVGWIHKMHVKAPLLNPKSFLGLLAIFSWSLSKINYHLFWLSFLIYVTVHDGIRRKSHEVVRQKSREIVMKSVCTQFFFLPELASFIICLALLKVWSKNIKSKFLKS